MSKQSGFLAKQAAIQQKMIDDAQRVTCELMAETLQITLHEEFGWGYDRLVKLDLLWRENYKHFLGAMNHKNPDADVLQVHLDRRLADVLEWAWQHGAKFDSWSEYFDFQRWMDALAACGLDGDFYAHRERPRNEVFPWSRIDPMVTPEFLWRERELCYQSVTTPDCRTRCSGCGANRLLSGGVCNG